MDIHVLFYRFLALIPGLPNVQLKVCVICEWVDSGKTDYNLIQWEEAGL